MTIPCRSRTLRFRAALCGSLVALLPACSPEPIAAVDSNEIQNGIWILSDLVRERDGKQIPCRPMLMELRISTTDVTVGQRAFPCAIADVVSPAALTLQRNGTSLFLGEENVGTLLDRSMDIRLPGEAGRISWDLDRLDAPYQETVPHAGIADVYLAKPEWRPDESPVAISFLLSKPEDKLVIGHMHAATLPGAALAYIHVDGPTRGTLTFFDPLTGEFRISPEKDFTGYDQLSFSAVSFEFKSNKAAIAIKYTNIQDPPIANATFVAVSEDTTTTFVPDAFDPDGDPLTFTIITPPKHGKASTEGITMTYSPDPNYEGQDTIEYVADDGKAKTDPSTIEITVFGEDDPPVAIGQSVTVTSDSATPLTLHGFDVDSTDLFYAWENTPSLGDLIGEPPHVVYVPKLGVNGGSESLAFHVTDGIFSSAPATVNITITPGPYAATLLSETSTNAIYPQGTDGSRLYYRTNDGMLQSTVWVTDGTAVGTLPLQTSEPDTFGFDNSVGGVQRTTFFHAGSWEYFTTSTKTMSLRLYRSDGAAAQAVFDIVRPGSDYPNEPSVGESYVNANVAYFPIYWRNTIQQFACQVWKRDESTSKTEMVYGFPLAKGACSGLWTMASDQYMFVGSSLVKFTGMLPPPVLVKDLGNSTAMPWMVHVGDKLFFQTRTSVGVDTQIDLWVTDGTEAGTTVVKQLEKAFFEFNVFSPTAFLGQLYFGHRKSLWSSDGTAAGTNIVMTLPTSNVVGDGAIGTLSVIDGRLYFLANSDAAGREPWVSDGTAAGTKLLRDIHGGAKGSTTVSTNRTYFCGANGKTFFTADDGVMGPALWSTDGTLSGTNAVMMNRPVTTIAGILGTKLLVHDGFYFYALAL